MLNKTVITLLSIADGQPANNFNSYDLARLQLSGLLDDDNSLTPEGYVIVNEILNMLERVL
jgi:hypothetical protein